MIIDSGHNKDSNEATPTSMDESSISLNDDTQLKPSTRHSINIDDDDNDEFCRMFMSNKPKFNNSHNYNSTPLGASRKNDKYAFILIHNAIFCISNILEIFIQLVILLHHIT
jgi:hypothetical protein